MRREESDSEVKMHKNMNAMFVNKTLSVCHRYLFSVPIAGKVVKMQQKNVLHLNTMPSKGAKILPLRETKSWIGAETAQTA